MTTGPANVTNHKSTLLPQICCCWYLPSTSFGCFVAKMARSAMLYAAGLLALFASCTSAAHLDPVDVQVLNFALNLEYLEAQFYACAAFDAVLSPQLTGGKGMEGKLPIGCPYSTGLSPAAKSYAISIAIDEIAHVAFLRSVLQNAAVTMPDIDIGGAFAQAADLAAAVATNNKITALRPKFNAYKKDVLFYMASFIFEDVGVTAYKGAAPLLKSPDILEAAAGILATEAYHGGAIRALLLPYADFTAVQWGLKVRDIVQAISGLRAFASGKKDDFGLFRKGTGNDQKLTGEKPREVIVLAPADSNSVAFSRSVAQVINIVTLGNGAAGAGGFFPNGLSGTPVDEPQPKPEDIPNLLQAYKQ